MGLIRLMVVCLVVLIIEIYGSQCCVREEREALLSIKASLLLQTTYEGYHDPLSSWVNNPYTDCCRWNRVTCHPNSGRVTTISLQHLNVYHSDNIDFSLFQNFQHLTTLNFSQQDPPFEASTPFKFTSLVNTQDLANISSLEVLILRGNYLDGPAPIQGNTLDGSIPTLRKSRSFLSTLDLRDNKLSGGIPDWILKMGFLRALLLGGNQLQGQLPEQLCQLRELSFLDLSRNNFTGNIPACFSNVSYGEWNHRVSEYSFMIFLSDALYWYKYNHLHLLLFFKQNAHYMTALAGGVEVEFRTKDSFRQYRGDILRFMSGLDLSCNRFTGEVPHQIGSLAFLRALNLSHNHFHGSIPSSYGNLTSIESLDLSYNNLNGAIPLQLQNLNSLAVFNVSYNNLSGTVPNSKQFGTFDQSSFLGNPYLLLNNSNRGNSQPVMPPPSNFSNNEKEDDSVIDFTSFIWSFGASYVAVLVILVTILWINPYWRRLWFYYIETCLYRCLYPYLKDAFY